MVSGLKLKLQPHVQHLKKCSSFYLVFINVAVVGYCSECR